MKYGVICAMEEEIKSLQDELIESSSTELGKQTFYEGKIKNQDVVLVRSGIGKVAAGITAALLVTNFKVDAVIHSGSAGGIGAGLSVGDIVISSEVAYHDVDVTGFGYEIGQLPETDGARFKADQALVKKLISATKAVGLNSKTGLIVTGDQFIDSKDKIAKILDNFPDALSCEMEGAAIGQVATKMQVPFAVVRSMSDVGDEEATTSFDEFIIEAGKKSAAMLISLFSE